ncbi:MAG: T9SS type B sorting domain-containing protein, partial [Polaribacter sp.]|uniref:T9SS type B sorting domain-containing protein n=1 Tax=Polaribacter sp. TaxID=1920175 RepID=UPI00384FD0C1
SGNDFSGDNIGNFKSTIIPGTTSEIDFKINFNQKVNFKITQNNTTDHSISTNEFFILRVGPNNKNITILDPDNQLLIDAPPFDGDFETGVSNNMSASEIHFKYARDITGATSTFQFVANQITEVEFKHKSAGIVINSSFNGNIILTCFTRDSDLDGIEDMFDLDSDNDGIPDFYETSADTDSDGVLNYLDLDADNDGIYDIVEAGNSNLDIDLNGVIDNAITYIGINGLVDILETVPDDKILAINYIIVDTDVDGIFNFVELDADNDACFDVFEAGFTDQNNDGYLGSTPIQTNSNGKVINTIDGYTSPNSNYITNAPIVINTPFENFIFCENDTDYITIDSTADGYQWQVSTDNGAVFNNLANNARYNGTDTKELEISDVPLTFNNYQYKVLMSRTGNSCINQESNAIILTVNPLPIPKENPTILKQCDSDPDKQTTFNLTLVETNISDTPTETFQYFATELAAIAGTPEVSDKTSYFVDTIGEAWVKTISEFGCSAISKIDLTVSYTPNEPYEETFKECDDFFDADGNSSAVNDDTDGITFFDLSSTPGKVSSDPDIIVELYETEDDRTKSLNEIRERLTMLGSDLSKYRNKNIPNTTGIKFPIFYKLISKSNNDCQGIGQFYLQINSVPTANEAKDMELCDNLDDGDFMNGIVQTFDLDSQNSVILGTQSNADYTVTYHLSKIDANSGNDPQASLFTNTIRDLQTIYVRVTDDDTGCFTDRTSFDLIVNPLPIANFVKDLEICDDNTDGSAQNGFSQEFDLELQTAGILGSQDPKQFSVSYHASLDDAQAGIFPLGSPFTNSVPFSQIIYARVYNSLTGCANGISNFNAVVNPEPTTENASNLSFCDDDLDGSDTNGFLQNIDLDSQITEILGTLQDPDDFTVTFHETQVDATDGAGALSSPYTNTTADQQTIFVRVVNDDTLCVNDDFTFDVIVNTLPDFEVTSPQILCLNDAPENIYVENPLDIYSYVWRDVNGNIIGDDKDNLDVYTGGNYTVTATTTNGTNCSRTKTITVSESDSAILLNSFVTIVDEGNNIGSENNSSISIDILNNNLGPGDYQFALINDDTNTSTSFQDEPLFENLEGGFYTIVVRDLNGCIPDTKLQVSVLQFPKFFTPNGDGSNDTWLLKGVNKAFYPNSSINVFNRYGKLVAQLPIDGPGWNGTYNSKKLPSDDYWYNVTLIPADPSKPAIKKTGNFSLLRK